jgi:hypothetical protein
MACSTDVQQFSIPLPYAARDQKTHSSNKGILILRWHFVHRKLRTSTFRVQHSNFNIQSSTFELQHPSFISLLRGEVCNAVNLCRKSPSAHITCSSAASIQPYSAECRNFLFAEGIRSGASGSAVPKQELGNKEIQHSEFNIRTSTPLSVSPY